MGRSGVKEIAQSTEKETFIQISCLKRGYGVYGKGKNKIFNGNISVPS